MLAPTDTILPLTVAEAPVLLRNVAKAVEAYGALIVYACTEAKLEVS
jgi:hypothetical protein